MIYYSKVDPLSSVRIESTHGSDGSFTIFKVDGEEVDKQLIHSRPKFVAVPESFTNDIVSYVINQRHDGVNLLFYRYKDSKGKEYTEEHVDVCDLTKAGSCG